MFPVRVDDSVLDELASEPSIVDPAKLAGERALDELESGSDDVFRGCQFALDDLESSQEEEEQILPYDAPALDAAVVEQGPAFPLADRHVVDFDTVLPLLGMSDVAVPPGVCNGELMNQLDWVARVAPESAVHTNTLSSVTLFCDDDGKTMRSGPAEAIALDINEKGLRSMKKLTASAGEQLERHVLRNVESFICLKPQVDLTCRLLVYMIVASYDGVDLTVTTKGLMRDGLDCRSTSREYSRDETIVQFKKPEVGVAGIGGVYVSDGGVTKILQTITCTVMGFMQGGKFNVVVSERGTFLQHGDRMTAAVMSAMQKAQCRHTPLASRFLRFFRKACTDSLATNFVAERQLGNGLHIGCQVHRWGCAHCFFV